MSPDPFEMRDAYWECPHGALPGDTSVSCGCWKAEAEVIQLPVSEDLPRAA